MNAVSDLKDVQGMVLFPGAGNDSNHSSLVRLEEGLAPQGIQVRRADFPYRKEGRKAPDPPTKLMRCVRDEATALADRLGVRTDRLVLGGRSMGGRMCSLVVAGGAAAGAQMRGRGAEEVADPLPAAGLVLVAYPLHPPGKPEKLRVDHFAHIHVPCLFVSGTKDPFGSRDELEEHTAAIPGAVSHVWIEGGGHGLNGADDAIFEAVLAWLENI